VSCLYFDGEFPEVICEGTIRSEKPKKTLEGECSENKIWITQNIKGERCYSFGMLRRPVVSTVLFLVSCGLTVLLIFASMEAFDISTLVAAVFTFGFSLSFVDVTFYKSMVTVTNETISGRTGLFGVRTIPQIDKEDVENIDVKLIYQTGKGLKLYYKLILKTKGNRLYVVAKDVLGKEFLDKIVTDIMATKI